MPPEAPFLFAIAGISGSLAGLAGLVAGLRRGVDFRRIDLYRLREIVEFAFANVLFALSVFPLMALAATAADALRIAAVVILVATGIHVGVLIRRDRRHPLEVGSRTGWVIIAGGSDLLIIGSVAAVLIAGTFAPFEVLLLVLLARPMAAFLLVLASFEIEDGA
ncbi:MAG: hypothetical protein HYX55_00645 [Chloroflexi bacterium]|nr:hypothetical protein [Chloroflexota bacterium]